jgi:hypothetical protein
MDFLETGSLSLTDANSLDFCTRMSAYKQEIEQLTETNCRLSSNVAVLKDQFESAVKLSSNLEDVFTSHHATVKELEKVKLERDDLTTRLTILTRTNSELLSQLEQPIPPLPSSPAHEKRVKQLENELSDLNAKISVYESEKRQNESTEWKQKQEIQMLCRTLSACFGSALPSLQEIIAFVGEHESYTSAVTLGQRQAEQIRVLQEKVENAERQVDEIRLLEQKVGEGKESILLWKRKRMKKRRAYSGKQRKFACYKRR